MAPPVKNGATSPCRKDGAAIFGHDTPETPWQMDSIGNDVEDEDFDGDDVDARVASSVLRKKGDARDTFKISVAAKDRAREAWMDNRAQHQRTLWESRIESVPPLQQTVAPLTDPTAPMCEDDDFDIDRIEVAMTGYLRGNVRYQSSMGVSLTFDDFLKYIVKYGSDLVPQLWLIHSNEVSVDNRPTEIVVTGRKASEGGFHSLEIMSAHEWDLNHAADKTNNTMELRFQYDFSSRHYELTLASGYGAMEAAIAYGRALSIQISSRAEEVFSAGLMGTRFAKNNLSWQDLQQYLENNSNFYERLWAIRRYVDQDLPNAVPGQFVFTATNEGGRATSLRLLTLLEAEAAGLTQVMAQVQFTQNSNHKFYITKVRGTDAQYLGFAWLEGRLGRPLHIVEKIMATSSWQSLYRGKEVPAWEEFENYLKSPGAIQSLLEVKGNLTALSTEQGDLYLMYRKSGQRFSSIALLTEAEYMKAPKIEGERGVLQLRRNDKGFEIVHQKGNGSGGITLAPDADQMDEESRRFLPQTENFGSTEPVCKPEPLFTPADVMPVPQLDRPADAVRLPKLEGFVATDPEVAKKFQTPPSDRIPVITGSVTLPDTIGGEAFLPEPPLGMVVAGHAAILALMLAAPAVEAAAAVEISIEVPAGLMQLLRPMRFAH